MCNHPTGPNRNPDQLKGNRIMAKGNRTTSTARRATAAKATPSPTETICRLEDEASAEAIGKTLGEIRNTAERMQEGGAQ
jgi:hypothetical protein